MAVGVQVMFNNSLALEYELLECEMGFARDEIRALILNSVRSSWLPAECKDQLMADLQADEDWDS